MSPRKGANLVMGAIFQGDAHEHFIGACPCLAPAKSMKGCVIHQVLHDREIEIEGAGLEHNTENPQGLPRGPLYIVVKDPNAPVLRGIQPGYQRKERTFAGAIETKQYGKC